MKALPTLLAVVYLFLGTQGCLFTQPLAEDRHEQVYQLSVSEQDIHPKDSTGLISISGPIKRDNFQPATLQPPPFRQKHSFSPERIKLVYYIDMLDFRLDQIRDTYTRHYRFADPYLFNKYCLPDNPFYATTCSIVAPEKTPLPTHSNWRHGLLYDNPLVSPVFIVRIPFK